MRPWIRGALGLIGLCLAAWTLHVQASTSDPATAQVTDSMAQRMQACVACHGPQGRASSEGYLPRIAGKPAGYLYNQLLHFRDGRRSHAPMARLLAHLSDDYLREIAAYFAELDLPYPPAQTTDARPDVLTLGQRLVFEGDATRRLPACVACHGERMTGVAPAMPGLLGLPRDYLIGQLGAWRNGLRRADAPDCMAQVAQAMTAQEVSAVATWLSAQTPPAGPAAAPLPADAHPGAGAVPDLPCGSR